MSSALDNQKLLLKNIKRRVITHSKISMTLLKISRKVLFSSAGKVTPQILKTAYYLITEDVKSTKDHKL